jgi:hypothetical protein
MKLELSQTLTSTQGQRIGPQASPPGGRSVTGSTMLFVVR